MFLFDKKFFWGGGEWGGCGGGLSREPVNCISQHISIMECFACIIYIEHKKTKISACDRIVNP